MMLTSCATEYKMLKALDKNSQCANLILRPISNQWYSASIDVVGKHLSGLLFIKKMETGSDRVVFTSEAGLTFFDFEFFPDGTFKAHYVVKMMNKHAVIQTLRKDFELLLGRYFTSDTITYSSDRNETYSAFKHKKEMVYKVSDANCTKLHRLELAGKGKKKVTITAYPDFVQNTDSLKIQHHTFDMKIKLTPIQKQ